jgi:hypothetical protein
MSSGTVTVSSSGAAPGKNAAPESSGFLANLDRHIVQHQAAISLATAVLAVLGVAAIAFGLARVSPALKVLYPF